MNVNEITALVIAVTALLPVLAAFLYKLDKVAKGYRRIEEDNVRLREEYEKLKDEQRQIWLGVVARGFLEAQKGGFLTLKDSEWLLTQDVREVYSEIHSKLRGIYRVLKRRWEREPTDAEIGYYVEVDKDLQQWMLEYGCPQLGLNQYGCLAVAAVYSREKTPQPPPPAQNGAK